MAQFCPQTHVILDDCLYLRTYVSPGLAEALEIGGGGREGGILRAFFTGFRFGIKISLSTLRKISLAPLALLALQYISTMRMQHPLYVALLELVGRFHLDVHMV